MTKLLKLDAKNLQLISELEKNSRMPLSKLANALKTSKEVVHYRLKKLISDGFIKRFFLVTDYFALGYQNYRLIVNLHNLKYNIRKGIIEELRNMGNIDLNVYLLSNWDFEINIWVKNFDEFFEFYNNFIEKYADYITDKNIYIVTKIHFFSHSYLHKNRRTLVLGEVKNKKMDEIDEKIIDILERNPREEIIKVAEKMKMSTSTINYRIKQLMIKKLIKGIIPILDKNMLNYNSFRIEVILNDPSKKKDVVDFLATQHNVVKISELIGRKDLDFEVDFKTTEELDYFLENLRLKVPQIKDFEVINTVND